MEGQGEKRSNRDAPQKKSPDYPIQALSRLVEVERDREHWKLEHQLTAIKINKLRKQIFC